MPCVGSVRCENGKQIIVESSETSWEDLLLLCYANLDVYDKNRNGNYCMREHS